MTLALIFSIAALAKPRERERERERAIVNSNIYRKLDALHKSNRIKRESDFIFFETVLLSHLDSDTCQNTPEQF